MITAPRCPRAMPGQTLASWRHFELKRPSMDMVEDFAAFYATAEVNRHLGALSRSAGAAFLRSSLDQWDRLGWGACAIYRHSKHVGETGVNRWEASNTGNEFIGGLIPSCWGRGVAVPLGMLGIHVSWLAARHAGHDLSRVASEIKPTNTAAQRVVTAMGFGERPSRDGWTVFELTIGRDGLHLPAGAEMLL